MFAEHCGNPLCRLVPTLCQLREGHSNVAARPLIIQRLGFRCPFGTIGVRRLLREVGVAGRTVTLHALCSCPRTAPPPYPGDSRL